MNKFLYFYILILVSIISCNNKDAYLSNLPKLESKIVDSFEFIPNSETEGIYHMQVCNDSTILSISMFENKILQYKRHNNQFILDSTIKLSNEDFCYIPSIIMHDNLIYVYFAEKEEIKIYDLAYEYKHTVQLDLKDVKSQIPFKINLRMTAIFNYKGKKYAYFSFIPTKENEPIDQTKAYNFNSNVYIDIYNPENFQFIFNEKNQAHISTYDNPTIVDNKIIVLPTFSDSLYCFNMETNKYETIGLNLYNKNNTFITPQVFNSKNFEELQKLISYNYFNTTLEYNPLSKEYILVSKLPLNNDNYKETNPTEDDYECIIFILDNDFKLKYKYHTKNFYLISLPVTEEKNMVYLGKFVLDKLNERSILKCIKVKYDE